MEYFIRDKNLFSAALLEMARAYESQMLLTTHSEEWLRHFIESTRNKTDDIAFGACTGISLHSLPCENSA